MLSIGEPRKGGKALHHDDGSFGCKRDTTPFGKATRLYLKSQPYRSIGIGAKCLEHVLAAAASHTKPKITHFYLHVQTSNQAAKRFYERHGFHETGLQEDYYKKILPASAWILEKSLAVDEACNESDKHT